MVDGTPPSTEELTPPSTEELPYINHCIFERSVLFEAGELNRHVYDSGGFYRRKRRLGEKAREEEQRLLFSRIESFSRAWRHGDNRGTRADRTTSPLPIDRLAVEDGLLLRLYMCFGVHRGF